jgi:hypothetical protein
VLLISWLVAAFRPGYPFPVLVIHGEQGSAKSTASKMLRELIDPNVAPLRSEQRDERDLMLAATNGWVIALDNLSKLPPATTLGLFASSWGAMNTASGVI